MLFSHKDHSHDEHIDSNASRLGHCMCALSSRLMVSKCDQDIILTGGRVTFLLECRNAHVSNRLTPLPFAEHKQLARRMNMMATQSHLWGWSAEMIRIANIQTQEAHVLTNKRHMGLHKHIAHTKRHKNTNRPRHALCTAQIPRHPSISLKRVRSVILGVCRMFWRTGRHTYSIYFLHGFDYFSQTILGNDD